MRSIGFEENLQSLETAEDIFRILAWKDQRNLPASKYKRATGVSLRDGFVDAGEETGEVAYDLPIVRSGDYNVRLRVRGAPDRPFQVEIRKDGQVDAVATHQPTGSGPDYVSVDLGWIRMDPGNHTISVVLPPGASLESVQISPPCVNLIEPENGWRAPALTTDEDLSRTLLQALEMESELPPADEPIEFRAGEFETLAPNPAMSLGSAAGDSELRATPEGLHAILYAEIAEAGLYAVSVWTAEGDGQAWLVDSCRRSDICPSGDVTPKWRTILTAHFNAGRHSFAVLLASNAMVGKLRLQRLKNTPEDYLATLTRVGFDAGPKGPITREKAREAMEWLTDRWNKKRAGERSCVIQTLLGAPVGTAIAVGGQGAGGLVLGTVNPVGPGGGGPPGGPGGPGGPPVQPPLPPGSQLPASPVLPVR